MGQHFVRLFDELKECEKELPDAEGSRHNLATLIDAHKDGDLYTLTVDESSEMFNTKANSNNSLFVECRFYELPCLMVLNPRGECDILWVHRRARGKGFGRTLVEDVTLAKNASSLVRKGSRRKMGIKFTS